MKVEVGSGRLVAAKVEVVAVPAIAAPTLPDDDQDKPTVPPAPTLGPGVEELAEALGIDLPGELQSLRFDGSTGSVARIPTRGAIPAHTALVVGVGKEEDAGLEELRKAAAALADATSRYTSLATTLPAALPGLDPAAATQAVVEGLRLGAYRFTAHKSKADPHRLERAAFYAADGTKPAALRRGVRLGRIHAEAVLLARDLVNQPPAGKRPPALAEQVRRVLRGSGVRVRVLDEQALARGGYEGLLAVGQGSEAPPRLVELQYTPSSNTPSRARRHVALVGKGITFDSGGLSLKSSEGMTWMKADMSGAAVVVAAVKAAAELDLPVKLTGVLCLAENMPSGAAQRPGDVYTARNGTTVEVLNTDAEGRLVLSDGLAHASEKKPDVIIDVATLTGAVITALGRRIAGLMSPDDDLAAALLEASERSGERLWRLPLPDDYRDDLKSDVADLKNIGQQGVAGSIIGGLFLKEFVARGIPWAHLDIAGLAWADKPSGYLRKGATGAPVRTLLTWLTDGARG